MPCKNCAEQKLIDFVTERGDLVIRYPKKTRSAQLLQVELIGDQPLIMYGNNVKTCLQFFKKEIETKEAHK